MLLNIVLNLILIPRYHAIFGAACAGLTTQALTALARVVIASKEVRIGHGYRESRWRCSLFATHRPSGLGIARPGDGAGSLQR
ncbi:MAG: polysaccharide biosynthesis C-terminal domain-containing protein [Flavobacteriales bacterium]|nr:polysaccharide biosynthesis C-terminal domain-containing protein [Flavobacteriales bacterium]